MKAGPDMTGPAFDATGFRQWLEAGTGDGDAFDRHVLASILAIAAWEASQSAEGDIARHTGLDGAALAGLAERYFPHAKSMLRSVAGDLTRPEDEMALLDLLWRCSSHGAPLQLWLAAMIARRAQRPNHLWQDLGLDDRGELSRLMQRHFAPLAQRNAKDMKWKKFLYRMICRDSDYSLCTAPSCAECDDFAVCFGDESGESLLARGRRRVDQAAL